MSTETRNIGTKMKGLRGGDGLEFGAGSRLAIEDGAELSLGGAALPAGASFTPAAGGTNICEVTIGFLDNEGNVIASPFLFDLWLSDAASGAGLTGTLASGTVTAKAASGAVFSTYTAKKDLRVQMLATGVFVLEITDSAKTGFYVCARHPLTGKTVVSAQLVTANYG